VPAVRREVPRVATEELAHGPEHGALDEDTVPPRVVGVVPDVRAPTEAFDGQPVEDDAAARVVDAPAGHARGVHGVRQRGDLDDDAREVVGPGGTEVVDGVHDEVLEDVDPRAEERQRRTGHRRPCAPAVAAPSAGTLPAAGSGRLGHRPMLVAVPTVGWAAMNARPCSKVSCAEPAVATLTYVYADSMAVLGPLSGVVEPHGYDLCARHADGLSAPEGWQVVRPVS